MEQTAIAMETVLAVETVPLWETMAHAVFRLIDAYGWGVAAVLAAPLISFSATQHYKAINRRLFNRKPITPILDAVAWLIVLVLSFRFWTLAGLSNIASIYAALTVACFHTAIVKLIFAYAPAPVHDALAQSGFPDDEESTVLNATLTALLGGPVDRRKHDQPTFIERRKRHGKEESQTEER
jgi:hypothetical protein